MALQDELLEQAWHLANRERKQPRQASLRRAVSSAYYALFHLLIAEAVSKWNISAQRPQLARIFEHSRMNAASERLRNVKTFPFTGEDPAMVAHLRKIAETFSRLYEQRQTADYDLASHWSRIEVLDLIDLVTEAFTSVKAIRNEPIMNDYLLSLFLKEEVSRRTPLPQKATAPQKPANESRGSWGADGRGVSCGSPNFSRSLSDFLNF